MAVNANLLNYTSDTETLKQYVNNIIKHKLLNIEEERDLLQKVVNEHDKDAKNKLILSNLRLVVSIAYSARKNTTANIDILDLINEGNIGLIRAIDLFDLKENTRFSTFATYQIYHYVQQYIYKNTSILKTPHEFIYELRSFNRKLDELQCKTGKNYTISELAKYFNITEKKVKLFLQYNNYEYSSLDAKIDDDEDATMGNLIADKNSINPEDSAVNNSVKDTILNEINHLSKKEQDVIKLRYGFIDGEIYTLKEVSKRWNVSSQSINKMEKKLLKKLSENEKIKALR